MLSCVVPLGQFKGGDLLLPSIGMRIETSPGDLLFFNSSALMHANAPVTEGYRYSMVFFSHQEFYEISEAIKSKMANNNNSGRNEDQEGGEIGNSDNNNINSECDEDMNTGANNNSNNGDDGDEQDMAMQGHLLSLRMSKKQKRTFATTFLNDRNYKVFKRQ